MKVLVPKDNPGGVKCSLRPLNFVSLIKVSMPLLLFFWEAGTYNHTFKTIPSSLRVPKHQVLGTHWMLAWGKHTNS